MFAELLVTAFVAGFVAVAVLGHALLFQAIFATKDRPDESADRPASRTWPFVEA